MKHELIHEELTEKIIGACFEVYNELGFGFLESVYEKALVIVLQEKGLKSVTQMPFSVNFRGQRIGDFFADIVVEEIVLLELKAVSSFRPEHEAQILNYLKATGIRIGLLVNFGKPKLEFNRYIF